MDYFNKTTFPVCLGLLHNLIILQFEGFCYGNMIQDFPNNF